MNPHLCRVVLRPRDPLEVLDLAFALVRWRGGVMLRLLAMTALPVWILASVLAWLTDGQWYALVVPFALGPLLQGAFTVLVGRLLFSDGVRARDALVESLRRIPALLGVWFVRGLALLGVSLTCGLALPFVQGALLYQTEAALLERVGPNRGLRRSTRLASTQPGTATVAVMGWYVLLAWFALVGEVSGQRLVSFVLQLGQPFGSAVDGVVTPYLLAGLVLFQPAYAVYRLLLYMDVRTRAEGWDLQVALRALGLAA